MKKWSFFTAIIAILFWGVAWQYNVHMQKSWNQAKADYDRMVHQQRLQEQWLHACQENPDLTQRFRNIEKTSSLRLDKIHFLLKRIASLYHLTAVTVQCQPSEGTSFEKMTCQFKANSLTDGEIFRFIEALPQELPNILGVNVGKIQRISSVTPKMLLEISSQKPLSVFSVSLTFDWIFIKKS